jgi:hypothetical protein
MSYVFDVGDDEVWSPALRVGDLYVRFLGEIADMLGMPTGLTAVASDYYKIDIDVYGALVHEILAFYLASPHPVRRRLIEGVLVPSVMVLDRAGRPISPHTDEEREIIASARERGF